MGRGEWTKHLGAVLGSLDMVMRETRTSIEVLDAAQIEAEVDRRSSEECARQLVAARTTISELRAEIARLNAKQGGRDDG